MFTTHHVLHFMRHILCVTCHLSHVMCHMSQVTCHMSHVICHFFSLPFLDKMLGVSQQRVCYPQGLPCLILLCLDFFSSFFDFTKHLILEISFATSLLLMLGELAGGGSVAVTRSMWQSTTRHVHLSVCFFLNVSDLVQIVFAIGDVSFGLGASICIGREIRRPLYAGFYCL